MSCSLVLLWRQDSPFNFEIVVEGTALLFPIISRNRFLVF